MIEPLQISLAAARVNAGLKQQEVAEKLGVSKQTVINWEKGRKSPTYAYLYTMADMYHIPMDNILLPSQFTLSNGKEADNDVHTAV